MTWVDEQAVLEVRDETGEMVTAGSIVDLGDIEPFQLVENVYTVYNPSLVNGLQILSATFENLNNVVNPQLVPDEAIDVEPEGEVPLALSFEVQSSGPFSFDVVLEHDASNPTPYRFAVAGSGVLGNNPIQLINPQPASPGQSLVGETFLLSVEVDLDAPVSGTLQVSVVDQNEVAISAPVCEEIPAAGQGSYNFDFSWTENESGLQDYQIWARYRDHGVCPVDDTDEYDISQGYQVDWQEDSPVLELKNSEEEPLLSGAVEDLGDLNLYQTHSRQYYISNPSTTNDFQISDVSFENLVNVINLEIDTPTPMSVGSGEEILIEITFEVEDPGEFSFDVNLDHDASNPTPYTFSVSGEGILAFNPIQSITPEPLSPGEILIGEVFGLHAAVTYDAPVIGALVVNLLDYENIPIQEARCQEITEVGTGTFIADFSWSETGVLLNDYTIRADFYSRDGCPPVGESIAELSMTYQVDWQEELPRLEITQKDGTLIPSGETIDLGQFEYYQIVELSYILRNTSSTSSLEINDIWIENLENLSKADTNPEAGFVIDPEGENALDVSFQADKTGSFSFDLVIDHQASNSSPYRITFQGSVVMTDNPIKFIVPTPPSPGGSLIGVEFPLRIEVGIDVPAAGALQVSLIDKTTDQVSDQECMAIDDNLDQARTFNLSLLNSDPGFREYSISARYRAQGNCPIMDSHESDLTQKYVVSWQEDKPELDVRDAEGSLVSSGDTIDVGQLGYFQLVELAYTLANTSTTSSLEVSGIGFENLVNLAGVDVTPAGSINLGPGEEQQVEVVFQVTEFGNFFFDLVAEHDAENSNPYRFSIQGSGSLVENPIYEMTLIPVSPASLFVSEIFELEIQAEINPPAPGVMEVVVYEKDTNDIVGSTCLPVLAQHSLLNVDLSWTESKSGDVMYGIQLGYHAGSLCPTENDPDAVLEENYQISWLIHQPVLIVNRPEGVTIFDGTTDFVGEHEFFRFVEVTYVIENKDQAAPLVINNIQVENMENLREVLIDPALPIELAPGESREIKINFQILMLEPFSFDLVWDHNGSNANPYTTGIEGTSKLNLGDGVPEQSWLYKFVESLIRSGFFLKLPPLWTGN